MIAVDDLSAWLTQVWDELEAAAREAYYEGQVWLPEEESVITAPDWDVVYTADRKVDARHIFRWSPASVLARIAADRQILALHAPSGNECRACCGEPYLEEYWDGETETTEWKRSDLPSPCPTVRLLALPYADRAGYQEAWRP